MANPDSNRPPVDEEAKTNEADVKVNKTISKEIDQEEMELRKGMGLLNPPEEED